MIKKHGCKLIIDAQGELLLEALKLEPDFVKPNIFELAEAVGDKPSADPEVVVVLSLIHISRLNCSRYFGVSCSPARSESGFPSPCLAQYASLPRAQAATPGRAWRPGRAATMHTGQGTGTGSPTRCARANS